MNMLRYENDIKELRNISRYKCVIYAYIQDDTNDC